MKTIMKLEDLTTIDQLTDFLSGTQAVAFSVISDKDDSYRWIQGELVNFHYLRLSRQGKGVVTWLERVFKILILCNALGYHRFLSFRWIGMRKTFDELLTRRSGNLKTVEYVYLKPKRLTTYE